VGCGASLTRIKFPRFHGCTACHNFRRPTFSNLERAPVRLGTGSARLALLANADPLTPVPRPMMTTNNRFCHGFWEKPASSAAAPFTLSVRMDSRSGPPSRHADQAQMLFALDEPQLQSWNLLSEISGKKVECWDETKRRQSA
jgi:hypothetical protein